MTTRTPPSGSTRINPRPEVYIAADTTPLGLGLPGVAGNPWITLIDELTVTWGRTRLTDHHEAQQAKFVLTVPANRADYASFDWRNRPVRLQWSDPRVSGGTPVVFFRGRITEVVVTPRTPHPRTRRHRGSTMTFSCTGKLTELGNRRSGVESWPAESGQARLDRIKAIAGSSVAGITMRAYWAAAQFAPRDVSGTDALSLLRSLYDTCGGDRMTYSPQNDTVQWVGRRLQPNTVTRRGMLTTDPTTGWAGPRASQAGSSWPPIPATEVESGGELTRTTEGGATRVEYTWVEAGVNRSGVIYDPTGEADRGVVQLSVATELAIGDWAKTCGSDWLDTLWREGGMAQPPPLTYRADRVGGFLNYSHAQSLIGGVELGGITAGEPAAFWLAGSPWPQLRYVPIVSPIGGVIRYANGGWSPTFYSSAVAYLGPLSETPLRASRATADSATGKRVAARDLHPAFSWADTRYVTPH